jgi:predicted metal-binding protein
MSKSASPEPMKELQTSDNSPRSCVLHVCTSCRVAGSPRESIEKRAGFKLYQELRAIFNKSTLCHQVEVKPAECIALYLDIPDGFMPRKVRPKAMRASILGRVPPLDITCL